MRKSFPSPMPPQAERRPGRFTPEGHERLRATALANRPWEKARGPVTAEGKARSSMNGLCNRQGGKSLRQLKAEVAGVLALARQMAQTRQSLI